MATGMFENEPSGSCLQTQQPPGVPDSPDSIPLPDSPPPETEDLVGISAETDPRPDMNQNDPHGHNNNIDSETNNMPLNSSSSYSEATSGKSSHKKESRKKPRLAEEYDPSEPLTSSDEEEHSLQLIEGGSKKSTARGAGDSSRSLVESGKSPSPPPRQFLMPSSPPQTGLETSPTPVVSGKPVNEVRSVSATNSSSSSSFSGSSSNTIPSGGLIRLDLNSIPVPPDENRRPVIHFSIPTRHRLLPISSLMKRQKSNLRKDGKDGGGQGDGSKGFEKGQDGDDEDEDDDLDDLNRPKISLVAEIFGGTDDEDDEGETETEVGSQLQHGNGQFEDQVECDLPPDLDSRNNGSEEIAQAEGGASRWKIVADEAEQTGVPLQNGRNEMAVVNSDKDEDVNNTVSKHIETEQVEEVEGGDEPEIIEIVTLNVPPTSRYRPLRRRPMLGRLGLDNGGEPEVIDIDDKDDDPSIMDQVRGRDVSKSPRQVSNERISRRASPSPPPRRASPPTKEVSGSNDNDRERRPSRSSPRDSPVRPERHFKRPHSSSSMSNCEEGEIVDQFSPNKKRKKDKKKKTKRRKRSKSGSPPPSSSSSKVPEKRLSDSVPPQGSGSENEDNGKGSGGAISWRKPSKRSQNRNYRDGKPKADDTFFQEKKTDEKQKSASPAHRRSKPSIRKERSPVKEKSAGSSNRHRRDTSPRNNRSHSKSPDRRSRLSRSRSRSSGRPYRGRRRYRNSRSKSSNSASDKSRSGRSSSRRRSRRRYRRSTSRHHAGDSRSPSYITEPIRSRSSHYSKLRDRSRTRSRDRHTRARHRNKRSITKSRSPSPRSHKRAEKSESVDRQRRKQPKEKEKPVETSPPEHKDKKKEKEKVKEKEKRTKRKDKEKPKEEEKSNVTEKEKPKEKEKKKKKKRREKSPTPVKAIVADGDRLVVSLSFQKGKSTTSVCKTQAPSASTEERKDNGIKDSRAESPTKVKPTTPVKAGGSEETDKSKDINTEQGCLQGSPAKLSSVTDEDGTNTSHERHSNAGNDTAVKTGTAEEKDTEPAKVTSSGGGSCGSTSPFDAERSFSAAADSTKTVTPVPNEQNESSQNHSMRSSLSPTTDGEFNAQGDSMVTSTGDSIDTNAPGTEDEAKSNTSSIPSKPSAESSKNVKTTVCNASPRLTSQSASSGTGNAETLSTSTSSVALPIPVVTTVLSTPQPVTPSAARPLIGNIPGLYASNAFINTGGAIPVPPPIVIPTPPPPRAMGFSTAAGPSTTPMLNANVLASVASALFAVRQNQPNFNAKLQAASGNGGGDNTASQRHSVNAFGNKAQHFPFHSNFRSGVSNNFSQVQDLGGGGESPMSPNSSDGDDLFEPPMDGGKGSKNGQGFGNIPAGPGSDNNNESLNSGSGKTKERVTLFDSLFGGPVGEFKMKPAAGKPDKASKSKTKHRKGGPKKETIKVNTSGGMTEGELRLTDEVPTSAVELIVKQKYLKKLNRQERVVEEVKLALKPYYSKRQVNKDEYKEILRRAVPKICHNKTGEINPGKIKELIDAYVKKFRHARKRGLDLSSVK